MSETHDPIKADAFRWACALGRLCAGHPVNMIWNNPPATPARATAPQNDIEAALRKCGGNRTAAAALLGIPRSSFYYMAKKLALVALAACLVGCKSQVSGFKSQSVIQSPPPLPSSAFRPQTSDLRAAAAVAPPQVRTITLAWDKGEPAALTYIYSTSNITVPVELWAKVGETALDTITLSATNIQEFFAIRNYLNGEYSDWARK